MPKRVTAEGLRFVDQFFKELDIPYFVVQGACLSIIRGGTFRNMTWADNQDIDVFIFKEHEPKNLVKKAINAGWTDRNKKPRIDKYDNYGFSCFKWFGKDICVLDVSFLMKYKNYRWNTILRKYRIYDGYLFNKPKMMTVQGVTIPVPNPPEEYLRQEYGAGWQIPSSLPWWKYPSVHRALELSLHSKLKAIGQEYKEFSPTF